MRPVLVCHMGTSIDGRLHPSRFIAAPQGVSADVLRGHHEEAASRLGADGWIVGRTMMAEMAKGQERAIASPPRVPREPHVADRRGRTLPIATDRSGRVHHGKDDLGGGHVVAVPGEEVSEGDPAELQEDGVSCLFGGRTGDDLSGATTRLAEVLGIAGLFLEGGGAIDGAFLKQRLSDEFNTLIRPERRRADRRAERRRRPWRRRRAPGRPPGAPADRLQDLGRRHRLAAPRGRGRPGCPQLVRRGPP